MLTVARNTIVPAPYNPRKIDALAKEKLKDNLETVGLVQPLIWNKRTGHLVGGHQRLEIIDGMKGTKDYELQVAAIDVDELQERQINIFLNNQSAMGDWDSAGLASVLKTDGLSIAAAGFDRYDLELILDDDVLAPLFASGNDDAQGDIATLTATDAEFREKRKNARANAAKKDDPEFFTVLVFNSRDECDEFARELGEAEGERYLNGRSILEKFRALKP